MNDVGVKRARWGSTFLAGCMAVSLMGCDEEPDFPISYETGFIHRAPLLVDAEYPVRFGGIRVATFARTQDVYVEREDGEGEQMQAIVQVVAPADRRVGITLRDGNGERYESAGGETVELTPYGSQQILESFGALDFTLPSSSEFESVDEPELILLLAWYDADQDGRLDLGLGAESEVARAFAIEHEGRTLTVTHFEHGVERQGWGQAHGWKGWAADGEGALVLDPTWSEDEDWTTSIDAQTEPSYD